jgi:two-component system LytT family response regulator
MKKLRALLVDDELLALKLLQSILSERDDIEVIGLCRNGREAKESINTQQPDIVFLDINMPTLSGMQVAKYLSGLERSPRVVFTTAFERHALDAFEVGATDYLLKPLSSERVDTAIKRVKKRIKAVSGQQSDAAEEHPTITIKDGSRINVIAQHEIKWVDAAGDYMCVHVGEETLVTRATMKELLEKLGDPLLVRVHRSTIVNLRHIHQAERLPKGEYLITLDSGTELKVSRNYRSAVAEYLGAKGTATSNDAAET